MRPGIERFLHDIDRIVHIDYRRHEVAFVAAIPEGDISQCSRGSLSIHVHKIIRRVKV